jgi:hypothetical protein
MADRDGLNTIIVRGNDVRLSLRPDCPPEYAHADSQAAMGGVADVDHSFKLWRNAEAQGRLP